MEDNKKLDHLFNEARNVQPLVSFSEVKDAFEQKLAASEPASVAKTKSKMALFIAGAIIVLAAGTGYYLMSSGNSVGNSTSADISPAVAETAAPANVHTSETGNITSVPASSSAIKENSNAPAGEPVEKAESNNPSLKEIAASKSKSETISGAVSVTSTAKVGVRSSYSYSDRRGKFALQYTNGELQSLTLNGNEIEKSEWNNYNEVIEKGKNKISASSFSSKPVSTDFMNVMIQKLAAEGMIDNSTQSVKLTKEFLKINDVEQSGTVHKKYLQLYKQTTGEDIGSNTVSFKH